MLRHVLKISGTDGYIRLLALHTLSGCLSECWMLLHYRNDMDEMVLIFRMCIDDTWGFPPDRLAHVCLWIYVAQMIGQPFISIAYETAMS